MTREPIDSKYYSEFNDKAIDFNVFIEVLQIALQGDLTKHNDDILSHYYRIDSVLKTAREKIDELLKLGEKASAKYDLSPEYSKELMILNQRATTGREDYTGTKPRD